ncbi:MAG: c-type cytochrome biogenesis protein CcsB, partial [Achromobacter sp.]
MSVSVSTSEVDPLWQEGMSETGDARIQRGRPDWTDALFFVVLAAGAGFALTRFTDAMDYYEKIILCGAVPFVAWLGWLWRPMRRLMIAVAISSLFAIWLYQGDLARAEQVFFLKYLFSSQSAILWMCALFMIAMVCYWIGFISQTAAWLGTALTWGAVFAGVTGLLVRWREGHLLGPDLGHIPVSNLYEVFVLFAIITALFY